MIEVGSVLPLTISNKISLISEMIKRPLLSALVIISILIVGYFLPAIDAAYDNQKVLDGRGDVRAFTIRERRVSGHSEIDIISLETFERVARVEAYLTTVDDISPDFGFIYTISLGGITASYDNGSILVTRVSDGEDLTGEVEVEIDGNQMSMVVQKTQMDDTEMNINASSLEYILDYGMERSQENYYDIVEGVGSGSVTPYQVSLSDPESDVMFNYLEETTGSDPDIDISSMMISGGSGSIRLEMSLEGEAFGTGSEEYIFQLGEQVIRYQRDQVEQLEGDHSNILDSGTEENLVYVVIQRSLPSPGELLQGSSLIEDEDGGWMEDTCPDRPHYQLDIFPFASGDTVEVQLGIGPDGKTVLSISTFDYDPSLESMIIGSCDLDSSGDIEEEEIDTLFDPILQGLKMDPPIKINGKDEDISLEFEYSGLMNTSPLKINLKVSFNMDLDKKEKVSIEIAPFRTKTSRISTDPIHIDLIMYLPDDWEILPLSLFPVDLGNYLSLDKGTVEIISDEPLKMDMTLGGISFDVRYDPMEEDPSNDPVKYEDIPLWVYIVLILAVIGICLLIIKLTSRRGPPPEDI